MQQFAGELGDFGRHGRREEQVLALLRQRADDAADRFDEAEIEHLIDFVEHEEFGLAEMGDAAVEMIDEPAGRRDEHVEALGQRADLRAMRHAAEDDGDREAQSRPRSRKLSAIWLASSRVGLSTSTRAPPRGGRRGLASS